MAPMLSFHTIPISLSDETQSYPIATLLVPEHYDSVWVDRCVTLLYSLTLQFRGACTIESNLSHFLESLSYVRFNQLILPEPSDNVHATSGIQFIHIGDVRVANDDADGVVYKISTICQAVMKVYTK